MSNKIRVSKINLVFVTNFMLKQIKINVVVYKIDLKIAQINQSFVKSNWYFGLKIYIYILNK